MTAWRAPVVVLRCDGRKECTRTFEGSLRETTASVRDRANMDGWRFGQKPGAIGIQGVSGQRNFDWCPTCPDPRSTVGGGDR